MAKRKKAKQRVKTHYVRARKRKGESSALVRRILTVLLVLLVFAGTTWGIMQSFNWIGRKLFSANPRFEIQHLVISCDGKLSEERIREYTGLREGMNLFAIPFDQIEKDLSDVSMIESVYLERKLPHTLLVKVKERVPVARILGRKSQRSPFIVDRFGYVLPPRKSAASLPLIKGFDTDLRLGMRSDHPDVETTLKIIALCDGSGELRKQIQIETLDVQYEDFIHMHLAGGTRVRMPRHSLRKKLINLSSVIKVGLARGQRYREIDMTLDTPSAPAVPF